MAWSRWATMRLVGGAGRGERVERLGHDGRVLRLEGVAPEKVGAEDVGTQHPDGRQGREGVGGVVDVPRQLHSAPGAAEGTEDTDCQGVGRLGECGVGTHLPRGSFGSLGDRRRRASRKPAASGV